MATSIWDLEAAGRAWRRRRGSWDCVWVRRRNPSLFRGRCRISGSGRGRTSPEG